MGGTTGETECGADCAGVFGGTAYLDTCGLCVSGTTGLFPCGQDCAGVEAGSAFLDNCDNCVVATRAMLRVHKIARASTAARPSSTSVADVRVEPHPVMRVSKTATVIGVAEHTLTTVISA